ncbi:MAG TPA: hypothetical protein VMR17_00490 [Xanthobacteraceae bacterium]|jgi:hypothetical protein|nr:hypothetical protein [Xanthobacteraceae bacterium]
MANDDPPPVRARRWTPPPGAATRASPYKSYRFAFRLIGIPALAVAGVFIYAGLRDRLVLPECDSDRAKKTLGDVLKQLKLEPARYEPIKTVSSTKEQVVCSAVLPLPDGATVAVDYRFYWQGNDADMKYSVVRKAPENPAVPAPQSPAVTPPLR